jgi:hypothetical protein
MPQWIPPGNATPGANITPVDESSANLCPLTAYFRKLLEIFALLWYKIGRNRKSVTERYLIFRLFI